MPMIIKITNTKFFVTLLSIFKNKKQIDITVDTNRILIECVEIQKFYLNINKDLFICEHEIPKFSIDPNYFYFSLLRINNKKSNRISVSLGKESLNEPKENETFILYTNTWLKIFKNNCYIKIPFLSTVEHDYEEIGDCTTKFIVDQKKIHIFSIMKGLVKYEIENDFLFLRKIAKEIVEEIKLNETDFIEMGDLSFLCNNDFSNVFTLINSHIDKVLFLFSYYFLGVQVLFNEHPDIYLEIQVPRSMIDL